MYSDTALILTLVAGVAIGIMLTITVNASLETIKKMCETG